MASSQQNSGDTSKLISEETIITETEEDVSPPPPGLTKKFKNVTGWLSHLCLKNKPVETGLEYKFGLFESPGDYTLFLVGNKIDDQNENLIISSIGFEPESMYFSLPKAYFKNLNREQLLEKVTTDLKSFTTTSKFKESFLKEAKEIVFEANGQIIWKK